MAPGSWSAPGKQYAVALASGAAYCKRLRTALSGVSARVLSCPGSSELCV